MKKKLLVAMLLSMVLCMVAAVPAWAADASPDNSSQDQSANSYVAQDSLGATFTAQEAISGGWMISEKTGTYVTKAQKKLFNKAMVNLTGVSYTPVFVMAEQVVAGTNYAYFCKAVTSDAKATTSWKVVVIYKPLSGKAKVTGINDFNYKKIKTIASAPDKSEMTGAWQNITRNYKSKVLPKAARKAFNKAAQQYVGVSYTPLVLLSTQVVAGTNYRYLCSGVVPGTDVTNYYAIDVYKDLSGKAEITSCELIDVDKYFDAK